MNMHNFFMLSMATAAVYGRVTINMRPMSGIPTALEDQFNGFFYEPYGTDVSDRECYQACPCSMTPRVTAGCLCDLEDERSGTMNVTLDNNSNGMEVLWQASDDQSSYVSVVGPGRTRIEFQTKAPCTSTTYQTLEGDDIEYSFSFVDQDGYRDSAGAAQKYKYDSSSSFLDLGVYQGQGSECEIYFRLEFDADDSGELALHFNYLKIFFPYDDSEVIAGDLTYDWSTRYYLWVRDAQDRRRSTGLAYDIKKLPEDWENENPNNENPDSAAHGVKPTTAFAVMALAAAAAFL